MKQSILRLLALICFLAASSALAFSQVSSTASVSGAVTDPNGAVIVGAIIVAKNPSTGVEFTATTVDNGTFTIPAVSEGTYTIRITAPGFKQAVVKDLKVNAGTPASVNVTLSIGDQKEEVEVVGGSEVLQTQSATVNTTIVGRQITDLPFTSRNSLDLLLFLPGTATNGVPRNS